MNLLSRRSLSLYSLQIAETMAMAFKTEPSLARNGFEGIA